jgi:hypothetical protein
MVKGRARQHQEHGGPERANYHSHAPSAAVHDSVQRAVEGAAQDGSLLSDARLGGRGNGPVRAAVMQRMQQSVGNRALQRLLRSPSVAIAPAPGEVAQPAEAVIGDTSSVQRTPDGQIAIQKASELDTTGAERFTTPSGKFYRFASVSSHKNSTSRPQFQHPATAMKAYSGAGSNGAALIHPAVSSALNTLMAALIAEGARLDDESMKQAVVDNGYRPSALSEGQAYLGALKKTIAQNPKIFGELTFPSSLESTATSELGFSGSSAHNAFRDEIAKQPGWNASLAQQLVSITAGFKAPRGGSTHHSGLVVDINFPYATSDKSSKFHGIARENNANALRSAAGNWLNTFAPGFGFDSYDTGKEIWHMEWRDWSGTSADPKGAAKPASTPAAPSGGTGSSVQQMRASVQRRAVQQAGPGMQRRPTLSRITPVQRDDPKPGWSNAGKGSSNAGEKQVGAIRRIPIEGLDVGNKSNDLDDPIAWEKDPITKEKDKTKPTAWTRDKTRETAAKRAIVLVPDNLNTKDPIEVLLHLHGFGIGYRQPKGGGASRDEDNDKTAAQLEAGKRNMIAVLPQGAYFSGFGSFNSDTYLTKVFAKLIEMKILPEGTTPGRVIFSAHSGGGDRVTAMLGQKGTPNLPSNMAELVLFDGIHSDGQANLVANWVKGHMDHDLAVLTDAQHAADDAKQREYLKSSMRFRGYHTAGGSYEKRYKIVKDALAKWFSDNETRLGGKSSTAYQGLELNYKVIPTGLPQGAKHDKMMGESGGFEESIKALDALPPPPATTGAPAVQKMRAPGSQAPVQRVAGVSAAAPISNIAVQRADPYSEEDAKKIKEKWEKEGAYTTSDTGDQKETRAYYAWKVKANKVLKPTKTLTKEKIDELKAWIGKYEAHELWALRSTGTEPEKPGNAPAELTALEVKKGVPLGAPPTPAYRKVTKYDVTMPGTKNAYSFKDDPVATSYSNLRNETGVAKLGKKIGTRADIDKRFDDAGVTDATVRKVMKKVSTEEGGFEAVNTYDTGFISSGFIQFISGETGNGSLSTVLREMKKSNATEFATYFHDLGIDVDDKGLVVVDPSQGKQLRGSEAVQAVMNDKRLTAVFHQAGANSAAFQAAQIKTGYSEYYVADHSFTVKEGTVTISGKYGDVLKSEAGKTAIMDRGVQRGVPGTKEVFKKVCRDLIKAHKLTTLEELAKYEITIIASIQNRIKVLEDSDLTQPAAAPADKPADKPAEEKK